MYVTLDDGSKIECDDEHFAEGGEGRIYWDKAGTHVIKLYTKVESTREQTLREIVGPKYNVVLNQPALRELFAWPEAIIKAPRLGITMPRVQGKDLLWFLFPKSRAVYASQHGPDKLGKWKNYLSMAIKMAQAVAPMHNSGLCHSDLSFKNFMGDPIKDSVVLLDCDSLVVPSMIPPKVLGTPFCMAPELAAQLTGSVHVEPNSKTDLHALATLIYWLLLQRHPLEGPKQHDLDPALSEALALGSKALFVENPTDHSNRRRDIPPRRAYDAVVTPAVAELIKKAFVDGLHVPDDRPTAVAWKQALTRMVDALVPCDNPKCPMGQFVLNPDQPGQPTCLCGQPLKSAPVLPIFRFYRPVGGKTGQFMDDNNYIFVGWPERKLQAWHSAPGDLGPTPDKQPKAELVYENKSNKWFIQNLDFPEMKLLDSLEGAQDVHPGQKVEIRDASRLLLGHPTESRIAYVQMKKMH